MTGKADTRRQYLDTASGSNTATRATGNGPSGCGQIEPRLCCAPRQGLGHSLRHASRRAIDLASNVAHERYLEVPLRAAHEDRGMDEQAIVERLGMAYVSLPVSGPAEVTFDNAAALDQVLADNEGRILLHCSSGNRAAALYTLREKMLGASNDDALATGKAAGLTRLEAVVRERLAEE